MFKVTRSGLTIFLLAGSLFLSGCGQPPEVQEQGEESAPLVNAVTKIIDGDSFVLSHHDGKVETIDLKWVDAPEREQPFGREARQYLKDNLLNQTITFTTQGEVLVNGENLNLALVRMGYAWLSPTETDFTQLFAYDEAQNEAMNHLRGFWGLTHELRVPPWVWREQSTHRSPNMMALKREREAKLQEQRALQQQQMQEKFRKLRENRLKQMEAHGSDSRAAAFKKPSSKESDSNQKN